MKGRLETRLIVNLQEKYSRSICLNPNKKTPFEAKYWKKVVEIENTRQIKTFFWENGLQIIPTRDVTKKNEH